MSRRTTPSPNDLNRIKERVVELGITQAEAAFRCGEMYQSYFTRLANGHVTPSIYMAFRIAEGLGTTVDYLFNRSWRDEQSRAA